MTVINEYQDTADLQQCMSKCLETPGSDGNKCRSVVKSTSGNSCKLLSERSDDAGVTSQPSDDDQYFDRPSWYLGMW